MTKDLVEALKDGWGMGLPLEAANEIERLERENAELRHDNARLTASLTAEVNAHEPEASLPPPQLGDVISFGGKNFVLAEATPEHKHTAALRVILDYCDNTIAQASGSDDDVRNIFDIAYEALTERKAEKSASEPEAALCGALHLWGQATCELRKGHDGPHGHYQPAQVFNEWPAEKSE